MSRIVITTWGSYGDVNPYLALGTALRARGHDPVLCMPPFYELAVRAAGLEFTPAAPDADPDIDHEMIRRVTHPTKSAEVIFREVLLPSLAESHALLSAAVRGADLMVSHPTTLAAPIVAEQTGIHWISTVLAPMNFMSAHDPIIPPMAPWLRHVPLAVLQGATPTLARLGRMVGAHWTKPVQDFRRSVGLAPGANAIFEGQHSPEGVLALYSPVLGGPFPDWPAKVTITGQLRYDASFGATLSEELQRFLDAGDAPIVFTLGSSVVEVASGFWDESLEAARRLGRRAVLLSGRHHTARLRAAAPAGVIAVEGAPHSLLFPRAAAIVHPCGMGTTGTALASGHPMLAVPYANDQHDTAWRLTRLGVARTLYPSQYRAATAARELSLLLMQPEYTRRARDVADQVAQDRGVDAACEVIERVLAAG
ncbi:MAG TPA: glycosyltransferase [Gemmatimonas sp.]|nr:glycosyltransferase [Gemmatimonas sp.]